MAKRIETHLLSERLRGLLSTDASNEFFVGGVLCRCPCAFSELVVVGRSDDGNEMLRLDIGM